MSGVLAEGGCVPGCIACRPEPVVTCRSCGGSGRFGFFGLSTTTSCPSCNGSGRDPHPEIPLRNHVYRLSEHPAKGKGGER